MTMAEMGPRTPGAGGSDSQCANLHPAPGDADRHRRFRPREPGRGERGGWGLATYRLRLTLEAAIDAPESRGQTSSRESRACVNHMNQLTKSLILMLSAMSGGIAPTPAQSSSSDYFRILLDEFSVADGINDRGQIVGYTRIPDDGSTRGHDAAVIIDGGLVFELAPNFPYDALSGGSLCAGN